MIVVAVVEEHNQEELILEEKEKAKVARTIRCASEEESRRIDQIFFY
jgi:hypothetical protein